MGSVQAAWRLGEGGGRGQASPRPGGHRHGHAFPPSTLHRQPPKSRTLCFSEDPQPPDGPSETGPLKSQQEAVKA